MVGCNLMNVSDYDALNGATQFGTSLCLVFFTLRIFNVVTGAAYAVSCVSFYVGNNGGFG